MRLTLVLPTGRIQEETVELFRRAGIDVGQDAIAERRLRVESESGGAVVLAKDPDVPTYVEHGVADVGVVGKDVLEEHPSDVYRPLDLRIGRCRMVVAQPATAPRGSYRRASVVRVATKYPRVATKHFHSLGLPVEVIPLAGSVELAPLIGLADCIVDIVQTGRTLDANSLVVDEVLFESTAYLIVNRASYRTKTESILDVTERLERAVARDAAASESAARLSS